MGCLAVRHRATGSLFHLVVKRCRSLQSDGVVFAEVGPQAFVEGGTERLADGFEALRIGLLSDQHYQFVAQVLA